MNKHAAWSVSEILMPCNDLHKEPYTIRRAANLVIRDKFLGFLQALHNEPEPDVSFYMCRVSRLLYMWNTAYAKMGL